MAYSRNIILALVIVAAIISMAYLSILGYMPGLETVQPDYLDPDSPNYMRVQLINANATEYLVQFRHQKQNNTWTRTISGEAGVRSYLSIWNSTGQINSYQYAWGIYQLDKSLLAEPIEGGDEVAPPIEGGGGGDITPPPADDDDTEPVEAPEYEPGGIDMIEIAIWIMIGLVSMVLAWLATVLVSAYVPQLQEPVGMLFGIAGFFIAIFWVLAIILGLA